MSGTSWVDEIMRPTPILLVEDNENDCELFRYGTDTFHRELLVTHTGEEALTLLAQRPDIKLVVLDERLPGMSGLETFRLIRAKYPALRVVFFSGHVKEFVEQVQGVGFAAVMSKPASNFRQVLTQMLNCLGVPLKQAEVGA